MPVVDKLLTLALCLALTAFNSDDGCELFVLYRFNLF